MFSGSRGSREGGRPKLRTRDKAESPVLWKASEGAARLHWRACELFLSRLQPEPWSRRSNQSERQQDRPVWGLPKLGEEYALHFDGCREEAMSVTEALRHLSSEVEGTGQYKRLKGPPLLRLAWKGCVGTLPFIPIDLPFSGMPWS